MDHLKVLLFRVTLGAILPGLPVESHLESVFHRRGAAFHEEEVLHGIRQREAGKGVHEGPHLGGVKVRVGRFVEGRLSHFFHHFGTRHVRVVVADGRRGEEGHEVQKQTIGLEFAEAGSVAPGQVGDDLHSGSGQIAGEYAGRFAGVELYSPW